MHKDGFLLRLEQPVRTTRPLLPTKSITEAKTIDCVQRYHFRLQYTLRQNQGRCALHWCVQGRRSLRFSPSERRSLARGPGGRVALTSISCGPRLDIPPIRPPRPLPKVSRSIVFSAMEGVLGGQVYCFQAVKICRSAELRPGKLIAAFRIEPRREITGKGSGDASVF
jgi:hypothetical protein